MELPLYNFDALNETDIREEIVAPLLRHLGYRSGTDNNVIREQSLNYPKSSLGRRKESDPILRGRADYICIACARVRWVIEAKAPDAPLDEIAQAQAWSYANHPEIRAVYFCLTNGRVFKIFRTNGGPDAPPIFSCEYEHFGEGLQTIENILSPVAVIRDNPDIPVDTGRPIGPGLRSIVRIAYGEVQYRENSLKLRAFNEMIMTVTSGSVERNEAGLLEAHLETMVPFQQLQKLNEKLGLHSVKLISHSDYVSDRAENQTVFRSENNIVIPKGESTLDLRTWTEQKIPFNITVNAQTLASGSLEGNVFAGTFSARLTYQEFGLAVSLAGSFRLRLA